MDLADLRTEVLNHGFDPVYFSPTRLNQYLNDAYLLVCSRVDYYVDEGTQDFTTVAGTTTYALPTDFGRQRSLRDTNRDVEMTYVGQRVLDRSNHTSTGAPQYYAFTGAGIQLYPVPDGAYPLELRYWVMPTALANDSDVPTLPARWHRLLWYWATKEAYAAEDDAAVAQYWEQQFNTTLSEFAADVKFPSTDGPTQISSMFDQEQAIGTQGWSAYGWQ